MFSEQSLSSAMVQKVAGSNALWASLKISPFQHSSKWAPMFEPGEDISSKWRGMGSTLTCYAQASVSLWHSYRELLLVSAPCQAKWMQNK